MIPADAPHLQYLAMIACRRSSAESPFRSNSRKACFISVVKCNPSIALIAANLSRPILKPPVTRVPVVAEPFLRGGANFAGLGVRFTGLAALERSCIAWDL